MTRDELLEVLRRIAEHDAESPVDEWSEARAYHEVQDMARDAVAKADSPAPVR